MQVKLSVSSRGLIALPAALREAAGIRAHDSVIAETTPEGILLRPAVTLPVEIYSGERVAEAGWIAYLWSDDVNLNCRSSSGVPRHTLGDQPAQSRRETGGVLFAQLVLPHPDDLPTGGAQGGVDHAVAGPVPPDFFAPE